MDLREARLCLDCEEIFEGPHCPLCASESFAFVSRWVPARARRTGPKPAVSPEAATYRRLLVADAVKPKAMRLIKRGAVGLAVVSLARWLWRQGGPAARRERPRPGKE
jgi:hypothetical protein